MALFKKQDFTPPMLSKKWLVMQFRPNMLIYCQDHVVAILESGLLFREDSIEIEQDAPSWMEAEGSGGAWLTTGEKVVSVLAVCTGAALFPPRSFHRWSAVRLSWYLALPVALRAAHRWRCAGSVRSLLTTMCNYLMVARRSAACCREYAALHSKLESVTTVVQSMQALLIRQQADMVNLLSRVSSAVLGNMPWLRGDLAWEAVCCPGDSLMKIHHTFLVVQSLLLKHLAMAHYINTVNGKKVYINHNERIYWLHNVVIKFLITEYKDNYEALERMYRLLKNCGTMDDETKNKTPGAAICNNWVYSEVHTDVVKSCLELKTALSKANSIDKFLDSCGLNKIEVDLDIMDKDIEDLIDSITKCLSTAQNSQIRLKKLQGKVQASEPNIAEEVIEDVNIVKIEDEEPEAKDEVFYCVKTEEDETVPQAGDILTAPGVKEKEASKVVLNELKRKLGKREDVMRERERQALMKTMPEYKDNVPEFPRQIQLDEYADRKGVLSKLVKEKPKKKLMRRYKIGRKQKPLLKKGEIKTDEYKEDNDIKDDFNEKLKLKNSPLTIRKVKNMIVVTKWRKTESPRESDSSGMSGGLSDVEASASNRSVNQAMNVNSKQNPKDTGATFFSKKDLELSPSSESDDEMARELLKDVRRHRATRKKNNQAKKVVPDTEVDESLRPIEYSFGTGMAMASVLHSNAKVRAMAQEEVFIGDGEVSNDSGHSDEG